MVFDMKLFLFLFHSRLYQPLFLGNLLVYFASSEKTIHKDDAYLYAFGIIICSIIPVMVFHPYQLYMLQLGMKIRLACCSLLYEKVNHTNHYC